MAGWEYQVIHINVEPPRPPGAPPAADGPPMAAPAAGEGSGNKPMFSQTFLKKEFPQFYEKPASEGSGGQAQHPAHQLQTFLNGHGAQGWDLVGVFPVGNLTMMFFRRPKPAEPKPASPAMEATATKPAMASESAAGPAAEAADDTSAREGTLHEILQRLNQLEERLRGSEEEGSRTRPAAGPVRSRRDATAPPARSGRSTAARQSGRELEDRPSEAESIPPSEWVSPAQLARLADHPPLPSSRAALAIGLRSAASLANHGARYGYTPGLSKRGPNGQVAIYTGQGTADKGGKERRLWIVVPAQRLEG
jgi:hypothetical protein